jgi:hypothetical protein
MGASSGAGSAYTSGATNFPHSVLWGDKLVSRQSYNAVPFVTMEQKKKLQLKHKNSLFMLQTFHYNYKTTFFKNIIPKSTCSILMFFLPTKTELNVVLHCNFSIIL